MLLVGIMSTRFRSPFKTSSPVGGLIAACFFGLVSADIVRRKVVERRAGGYGCAAPPRKAMTQLPVKHSS